MRLLFLNYEFPPVGGGAGFASIATARELVSMGHDVDFLTAANSVTDRDDVIDGVRVFRVACRRRGVHDIGYLGAASFLASAAPRLRRLSAQNRYDLYHYYFGLPTGLLTRIPGAHRPKPYVISLRGSDVPGYSRALAGFHRFMLPVTRRIWAGACRVVANSDDLRTLAQTAMPGLPIEVIRNGAEAPIRGRLAADRAAGTRILTVSRLIERKAVDVLIRALARSNDRSLSLDIAGDGPKGGALRELARAEGVADRVRFHGFTDRATLAELYASADVFALTSYAESCSMALLEAMAAGMPVIASRIGGNAELVRHGENGFLVAAERIDELDTAVRSLAADPDLRARFGAASRRLILERHSWNSVARAYLAVFQAAVENDRR